LTPLYFTFDLVGRLDPPPVTHPQYYYGFLGVALAWQFAFFVIGSDPVRFRPVIVPAVLEKLGYVLAIVLLYLQRRVSLVQSIGPGPDALLCLLFAIAFVKLGHRESQDAARTAG